MQTDPSTSLQGTSHGQTRELLLQAAAELFAERGFDPVTIREIASRAGVRHGGVNYHFRCKRELYLEVLARFGPPGNHVASGGNPELHAALRISDPVEAEVALRRMVRSHLVTMTEPPNPIACGLLEHEIKRPDGPDEQLFRWLVLLRHQALEHLIKVLAPHIDDPARLRLLAMGITSQCMIFRLARPVAYRLIDLDPKAIMEDSMIDRIADHIVQTTLQALVPVPGDQA
ncbi:MAG TPA: CerR family C-terminal domain-containing protein [Planctomycetota bacterium]|nr:CerR family C-terminal domain-containing protein [Planctomycetota bacterium]